MALHASAKKRPKLVTTKPTVSVTVTHSSLVSHHARMKMARPSLVSISALLSKRFSTVSNAEMSSGNQKKDKDACTVVEKN